MLSQKSPTELYLRGVDGCAVHQRGIVVVFNKVSLLSLPVTLVWLESDGDLSDVRGVVEVDDVDVEHQHCWAWDLCAWERERDVERGKKELNLPVISVKTRIWNFFLIYWILSGKGAHLYKDVLKNERLCPVATADFLFSLPQEKRMITSTSDLMARDSYDLSLTSQYECEHYTYAPVPSSP